MTVYVLINCYDAGEHNEKKIVGVFASRLAAEARVQLDKKKLRWPDEEWW